MFHMPAIQALQDLGIPPGPERPSPLPAANTIGETRSNSPALNIKIARVDNALDEYTCRQPSVTYRIEFSL